MIPSALGAQARLGIEEFLRTTFPTTTPLFEGALDSLLARPGEVFRGPYVSLKLPFRSAAGNRTWFPDFPPKFPPHLHQERAWERLDCQGEPRNTVVATGTGSGKTECFLYPVLDYCYQQRHRRGVKAILIYPMNALATDQAGRIAETVWRSAALRGNLRAGLFIGERDREPSPVMTESRVITSKDEMRTNPPDILLTNYKMLDYLLIRREDAGLWVRNEPETLRYLVIDELHTFDGAQGADVACLIRRIKERLRTPPKHLVCVGTSATLGSGADNSTELVRYATQVFGELFEDNDIIGESIQTTDEFLEGARARYAGVPGPEASDELDPLRYESPIEYLIAQRRLWLGDSALDPASDKWKLELGAALRQHTFLQRLLKLTDGKPVEAAPLTEKLAGSLDVNGESGSVYAERVLGSFVTLISAARVQGIAQMQAPLLQVRYQFWMRELARVVASIDSKPRFGFAPDLNRDELARSAAVVHCRECGLTGWTGTIRGGDNRLNPELDVLYRAFFDNHAELAFVFPGDDPTTGQIGFPEWLCTKCLRISRGENAAECIWCGAGEEDALRIWKPRIAHLVTRKGKQVLESSHDCPACEGAESMTIVGSRAASLMSVFISQLWASPFNSDKKLLAFSDNVQDASHRAGFFKARTFRFNLRSAIQKVVQDANSAIALLDLPRLFLDRWEKQLSSAEEFVAAFLPPDMEWLEDFEELRKTGGLRAGSDLIALLRKRLDWEIQSEYTLDARIGRSLEKTGSSTIEPRQEVFESAADAVLRQLREEIGTLAALDDVSVRRFLYFFLLNLKNRGGVRHPESDEYVRKGADWFSLAQIGARKLYMPRFRGNRLPGFLQQTSGFDRFVPILRTTPNRPSWHEEWLRRCFGSFDPDIVQLTRDVYRLVRQELIGRGVMYEESAKGVPVWGIAREVLQTTTDVRQMRCDRCQWSVSVSGAEAVTLAGAACPNYACGRGALREMPRAEDYYARLYSKGEVARIFTAEHTGLLAREVREAVEFDFENRKKPGDPNLLSCTPTLEMGVDIGGLSSVAMCSVPPKPSNYLQRAGRAGRRDGNAFITTVANARPHDLFFFARPDEMLAGRVESPGCFLNASAVLERQFTAFVMDRWMETGPPKGAVPEKLASALDAAENGEPPEAFPWNFFKFFDLNRTDMEDRFLAMFGSEISDVTRERLRSFSRAEDGMRSRLLEGLNRRGRDLKNWRKNIRRLNDEIKALDAQPMPADERDKATAQLRQEKMALQSLVNSLKDHSLLNFLTGEGLLPNYAFPEQGVTLQSIIWRERKDTVNPDERFETQTYTYERPAAAAIAELAPANRFYAEGRRVEVSGVVFEPADLVDWRLCPNCSWMEQEGVNTPQNVCPKCSTSGWSDVGQRQTLLRMRQVIANTSDRDSRSFDESDDRDPHFYEKNMFILKDDADIQDAYVLDDEEVPFGFEFFRRIALREVNFGEAGSGGRQINVAGRERTARSFELCKSCGKVKRKGEIEHAAWCLYRKETKEEKEKAVRACYLYREFTSEAIRMLLPVSAAGVDRYIESFVAALELGLRKRFKGDPGHLNTTVYDEPITGSESRKRYLVLYDGVPGGTGYLKELMQDPDALKDVFEKAYNALVECDCRNDGTKDGCYVCLLAYRGRHFQGKTSRAAAVDLLKAILDAWNKLKRTDRLDTVRLNRLLESELEAAFLEALRRKLQNEPERYLTPNVVNGKAGFYLRFPASGNWLIEPQVDLGPDKGVRVPSRADFVLYPEKPLAGELPIALFTDGYEWHADPTAQELRTGRDSAQRLAIARSGRYRVWSLTWADVQSRLDDKLAPSPAFETLLGLLTTAREAPEKLIAEQLRPRFQVAVAGANGTAVQPAGYLRFEVVPPRLTATLLDINPEPGDDWKAGWTEFVHLSNLIGFVPQGRFITSAGLRDGIYGSLLDEEQVIVTPAIGELEALLNEVLDADSRWIVKQLYEIDFVLPIAGYEIADSTGEIVAAAELAWESAQVCVMTSAQAADIEACRKVGWTAFTTDELKESDLQKLFEFLPKR